MHELWNLVKGHAAQGQMMMGVNRWGTVSDVRATDQGYDIRAIMQPDDIGTAWLPVLTAFGGAGWGMVARPSVGMQVLVAPDTGDGHHGIVVGMAYSTQAIPPRPPNAFQQQQGTEVGDGEWACVSKAGAVVRLCADGSVYIKAPTINIEGNLNVLGNATIQGDVSVMNAPTAGGGNVYSTQNMQAGQYISAGQNISAGKEIFDAHGAMNVIRADYNIHGHPSGGGPPIPQVPE